MKDELFRLREKAADRAYLSWVAARKIERARYADLCRASAAVARLLGPEYREIAEFDEREAREADLLVNDNEQLRCTVSAQRRHGEVALLRSWQTSEAKKLLDARLEIEVLRSRLACAENPPTTAARIGEHCPHCGVPVGRLSLEYRRDGAQ